MSADSAPASGPGAAEEELELTAPPMGFLRLVWSDVRRQQSDRPEPEWRSALLLVPRMLVNPSLQLALLVRAAQKAPWALLHPLRWLQIVLFSSEIWWFRGEGAIEIGPGISFPHPYAVLIGPGTRIGSDVTLYHQVTIGSDRHWIPGRKADRSPWFGDRAVVYSHSSVQGPYRVGHDAVVGIHVVVDEDVPPGALKTRNGLRLRGRWSGEERMH